MSVCIYFHFFIECVQPIVKPLAAFMFTARILPQMLNTVNYKWFVNLAITWLQAEVRPVLN